jgi:hypothetical protein
MSNLAKCGARSNISARRVASRPLMSSDTNIKME